MTIKEKMQALIDKVKVVLVDNKKLVIASVVTLVTTAILTLNINLIQIGFYRLNDNGSEIISILDKRVLNVDNQDSLYFKMGINYIIEHLDEEGQAFVDKHFARLTEDMQEQVIAAYNTHGLVMTSNQTLIKKVAGGNPTNEEKKYIQRINNKNFEKELNILFGENPKVTQDMVTSLYNIVKLRSDKLTMEHFKFSLYELMNFPHQGDVTNIAIKLLGQIEPVAVREVLFGELKMKPIEVDMFYIWVDVLNKKNIIKTEEYASFVKGYNEVKRIREEYNNLLVQEVDLVNVKESINLKTSELLSRVEKEQKALNVLKQEISAVEENLGKYTGYKNIDVYILDQYANGEYEAANPEKSWLLGIYKPGEQRLRIKVTNTKIDRLGVYTLEAYTQGRDADGLPYYIEVSQSDKQMIKQLREEIDAKKQQVGEKEKAIEGAKQEIDTIRKANNYNQTIELLEGLEDKKEQLQRELKTHQIDMQTLFGIGEIIVTLKEGE